MLKEEKKPLPSQKKKKACIFGIRNKTTSKLFRVTICVTPKPRQEAEIAGILWNIQERDNLQLLSSSTTVFTAALYINQQLHNEKYQLVTLNSPA